MAGNFLNITKKLNNFRKGFLQIDPSDEPTYLTFCLEFDFLSIPRTETRLHESPLFNESADGQSAITFLNNRGLTASARHLKRFKEILIFLNNESPWYFQSIKGVDKLWKQATEMEQNFKGKEQRIEVETLEAIDLRISELAALYRDAVYDKRFMRTQLPDNLRWFKVDIWIGEFRNIRNTLPSILGINLGSTFGSLSGAGQNREYGNVLNNFGFQKFTCHQCEFDFTDSFAPQDDLTITYKVQPNTNRFAFNVGFYTEHHEYPDGVITSETYKNRFSLTDNFLTNLPIVGNELTSAGIKVQHSLQKITNFPTQLLNQGVSELQKLVEGGSLGDAYGIGYKTNGDILPSDKIPPTSIGVAYDKGFQSDEGPKEISDNYADFTSKEGPKEISDVYDTEKSKKVSR